MAKKFSQFPSAASISPGDSVVGLKDGTNTRFSFATFLSSIQSLFVPTSRKVNNKALSSDITLDASDVGAVDADDVGVADGVASLDSNGKVPGSQLDLSGKQSTITASGILKGDGQGGVTAATAGTDYQTPLTAGMDYATPAQLADKANQSQLAYVETGTTASRNYTAGQYISLNGLLYTADTAIASGATFYTSGGNKNLTECVGGGFNSIPRIEQSYETTGITAASNCVIGTGGYTRIGRILLFNLYVWVTSGSSTTVLYLNLSDDIKPSSNSPVSLLAQNVSDDSTVNVYAVASGNAIYMKGTTSRKGFGLTGWWLTN